MALFTLHCIWFCYFDCGNFLSPRQNFVMNLQHYDVFQSFASIEDVFDTMLSYSYVKTITGGGRGLKLPQK